MLAYLVYESMAFSMHTKLITLHEKIGMTYQMHNLILIKHFEAKIHKISYSHVIIDWQHWPLAGTMMRTLATS